MMNVMRCEKRETSFHPAELWGRNGYITAVTITPSPLPTAWCNNTITLQAGLNALHTLLYLVSSSSSSSSSSIVYIVRAAPFPASLFPLVAYRVVSFSQGRPVNPTLSPSCRLTTRGDKAALVHDSPHQHLSMTLTRTSKQTVALQKLHSLTRGAKAHTCGTDTSLWCVNEPLGGGWWDGEVQ